MTTGVRDKAIRYILDRLCPSGGFCYYRLDEPNPHDTYYALAALDCLGTPCRDGLTRRYLQALQGQNGGFSSLIQAFFVLSSLQLLHGEPLFDPADCLEAFTSRMLVRLEMEDRAAETTVFQDLYRLAAVRRARWPGRQDGRADVLARHLRDRRQEDGGFGAQRSTLMDTCAAVAALRCLGQPLPAGTVTPFVRSCEHPVFGFTGIPGTALYFLEYLHAGLALCREIAVTPTYPEPCRSALLRCQTDTGGFARASRASATMENTCLAVQGFAILDQRA